MGRIIGILAADDASGRCPSVASDSAASMPRSSSMAGVERRPGT